MDAAGIDLGGQFEARIAVRALQLGFSLAGTLHADSLREASDQLRGRRKRKGRLGRLILLGAIGAGITLAVSESARKAVMDSLFGAEEEFEYTSTTGGNGAGA